MTQVIHFSYPMNTKQMKYLFSVFISYMIKTNIVTIQ